MIVRDSVSLIDASITCSRRALAHRQEALADPVEHDDGVVQRVADDGQDRRQRRQVERHLRGREEPRMMIGSCSAATMAPTPSFHWKRSADVQQDEAGT